MACALSRSLRRSALADSWPLGDQSRHFDLGAVLNSAITDLIAPVRAGEVSPHHAGCWECNVADDSLIWSGGVYDLFGLPRGVSISRTEAVMLYRENSRAILESLRTYALKHRRGFTLDVELQPATGASRWMRVIAAPIIENDGVVRLHGLKLPL